MNDQKRSAMQAIRDAQLAIHDGINDLRNGKPDMNFSVAWNILQKNRPDLFAKLDAASSELEKITRGENEGDQFFESQGLKPTTARDNVPPPRPRETRTPVPTKQKDPRITGAYSVVRSVR
jgi:hypothetical protein